MRSNQNILIISNKLCISVYVRPVFRNQFFNMWRINDSGIEQRTMIIPAHVQKVLLIRLTSWNYCTPYQKPYTGPANKIDQNSTFVTNKSFLAAGSWNLGIWAKEQMRDEERKDWEIRWRIMDRFSLAIRGYLRFTDNFHDGTLKRRFEDNVGEVRLDVVFPSEKVSLLLYVLYSGYRSHHKDINETVQKVRQNFYW